MSIDIPEVKTGITKALHERMEFELPSKQDTSLDKEPSFLISIKEIFSQFSLIH